MSIFGSSAGANPLFGGKPASAIFGNSTPQTNSSTNPLNAAVTPSTNPLTAAVTPSANPLTAAVTPSTNPLTAAVTPSNQPSSTNIFGSTSQQAQQQPATSGGIFGNAGSNQQPTSNIFGSTTTQQPASGGLFGSTSTTQPATSGGLFGSTSNQQPQQPALGGGLFGSTTNQQQQQQQQQPSAGGGLFGSTTQQPTQQSGTTSLFGNVGSTGSQTGTSPFGSTGGGTSLFANTGTSGGGTSLFGNTGTSGQQTGSSLFGSTNVTNQPQTSLFGKPSTGTSIFGTTPQQQQQQQQQPSLFGSISQPAQPAGGFGTSSLFGKPATNLNQSGLVPSNQQAQPGQFTFTKATKFNDLPDNIKQLLEGIDSHIQGRVQISKDLHQRKLGEEPTKGQEMVRQLQKDFLNASNVIRNDLRQTEDLKSKVDQAVQDTIVASRIIDAFRSAQSGTTYLKDHAGFPLEFFQRVTQQMIERLAWYKTTIEQIERRLSSSAGQVATPQSIAATLQAQNATFLALASKTAALEAELQKIKVLYTQLWRAKTGSVRDPFIDGENLSFGS